MASASTYYAAMLRRRARTRASLAQNQEFPRLSVHRTLRHIYAQIIDDKAGRTLVATSDKALKLSGTKTEDASKVGQEIAKLALAAGVTNVRFDRGSFKYHGRIAAVAEAAREAGLQF